MPITNTATNRSSSTPASTMTGMTSERSRPKTKTPFSRTRKPEHLRHRLLARDDEESPAQTVESAVGTRNGVRARRSGSGSRRENANARATPTPPSTSDGTKPTIGSISRRIAASRIARKRSQGMRNALDGERAAARAATRVAEVVLLAGERGAAASAEERALERDRADRGAEPARGEQEQVDHDDEDEDEVGRAEVMAVT